MLKLKQRHRRRWHFTFSGIILFSLTIYVLLMVWHTHKRHYKHHWRKVNRTAVLTDEEQAAIVGKKFPNVPIDFWVKVKNEQYLMFYKNTSCALFPNMTTLDVNNLYWQTVHMSNHTTVQLYSAFYDTRLTTPGIEVKILAMVNRTNNIFPAKRTFYCHLWFDNENEPVISSITNVHYIWHDYWEGHNDGMLGPYLLSCPIPKSHERKIPRAMSFVENACDNARNMLTVIHNLPKEQKDFSVCVKELDLFHVDLSVRLVEWIEFILLMGAEKIYFYQLDLHHNVKKVLEYYTNLGKVEVSTTTLPPGYPNIPLVHHKFIEEDRSVKTLTEVTLYNDCFYKNMYNYKYVVILDIDEIIVPRKDMDWHGLMSRVQSRIKPGERYASYNARNVYFLDSMTPEGMYPDIPPYMHMLQHVYRSKNFTLPGWYVKSFFNTQEVISCHNHLPMAFSNESINTYNINVEDGFMQHYRQSCALELNCEEYIKDSVKDTRLWDFKDVLTRRVNKVFDHLGLFSPRE